MERSRILGAGVWTVVGLAAAFAVVGATSSRHCATATKATAAKATVATAAAHDCCASDEACTSDSKVATATPKAAPKAAPKAVKPVAKPAVESNPVANGMVIAIDPESGTLGMPSATQMQQLHAQVSLDETSKTGATQTVMPDGSVRLDLNGSFAEYATIQITPDGKRIFGCSTNPNALEQPAPTTLEEK